VIVVDTRVLVVSASERRVLEAFMFDGSDNETIARRLSLTSDTVRTHLRNIYARAGIHTRTELALAIERQQVVLAVR
jgi:DNA-binding NarL/FixJ family response regulator